MSGLQLLPDGVTQSLEVVERFDDCLLHGFARLGEEQRDSLTKLSGVLAGSPLESSLSEAVAAVGRSEFIARHFLVLALARAALLGAVHDALLAQARAEFKLPEALSPEPALDSAREAALLLTSTQQWLMELALAGFKHLEENSVAPFMATLEHLQTSPQHLPLAAMLTGYVNELLRHMPTQRRPGLPVFRWADLWAAAMIRTQYVPAEPAFQLVSGTLTPLGLDVQSHDSFVAVTLFARLEGASPRIVRVPLTSYKVNVIAGPEIWDLFGEFADPILEALAGHKCLNVANAELRETGDLVLQSPPKVSGSSDPFMVEPSGCPSPPAALRHPIHIAQLVRLPVSHGLALASQRMQSVTELDEKAISAATEMLALLRFDRGQWCVQPLCLKTKKGYVIGGQDLAKIRSKLKNRSLPTLRERAGRLLRS